MTDGGTRSRLCAQRTKCDRFKLQFMDHDYCSDEPLIVIMMTRVPCPRIFWSLEVFEKNINKILQLIKPGDKVLDIGGWFIPFWRADYVIDVLPYETRGCGGHVKCGLPHERFSKETWMIWDISSNKPWPFKDKEFDFIICSHTLEDVRNPIQACKEIARVGKRGYIEVPSRMVESTMGVEHPKYCGWYHHRWLIDVVNNELRFHFKSHSIHGSFHYHFPKKYLKKMRPEDFVSWMFWENEFQYREVITISKNQVNKKMEDFVRKHNGHPCFRYWFDLLLKAVRYKLRSPERRMRKQKTAEFWDSISEIDSR